MDIIYFDVTEKVREVVFGSVSKIALLCMKFNLTQTLRKPNIFVWVGMCTWNVKLLYLYILPPSSLQALRLWTNLSSSGHCVFPLNELL